MNLPFDIIKLIFDYLQIMDKRSLIRSNKYLNQLFPLIKNFETEFMKIIKETKFVTKDDICFNNCEKYTLEYIYYDRDDIPDKYLEDHNKTIFTEYLTLHFNMASRTKICKKIYQKFKNDIDISKIMNGAAYVGNIEMLKWACDHGGILDEDTSKHAAAGGHLRVLKWARRNGCMWDSCTCYSAVTGGHLRVLKWAWENGCPANISICYYAALNGHLQILKWARRNGFPWSISINCAAVSGGHLAVLKWARRNGCEWQSGTCRCAALNGHLQVLKWARLNGCKWDEYTYYYAAFNGHLEILKWAYDNDCPFNITSYRFKFVCGTHTHIIEWAEENGLIQN